MRKAGTGTSSDLGPDGNNNDNLARCRRRWAAINTVGVSSLGRTTPFGQVDEAMKEPGEVGMWLKVGKWGVQWARVNTAEADIVTFCIHTLSTIILFMTAAHCGPAHLQSRNIKLTGDDKSIKIDMSNYF